jgi:hypothetical protein
VALPTHITAPAQPGDRATDSRDAPSVELAGLVIAAGQRGFPRWRVATALGISASGLASIEARIGAPAANHDRGTPSS